MAKKISKETLAPSGDVKAVGGSTVEGQDAPQSELSSLKDRYESGERVSVQGEGEEVKPKRKRRTKAEMDAERAQGQQAQLEASRAEYEQEAAAFGAAAGILLDFACKRMPNPLPPSPQEQELFSNAVGKVAMKYLPQAMGYGAEISLAVACLVVLAPRAVAPVQRPMMTTTN